MLTRKVLSGPSPSRQPILAFFAGGMHGPIRPAVLEHWKGKDSAVKVYEYLPKKIDYYDLMKKSKYCLCPSGYEVASPRIVEAIYVQCVPEILSGGCILSFSDMLNWKSFSATVPVPEIRNLKKILMGISTTRYMKMQRRVKLVRRHFLVNNPPKRYDIFHMMVRLRRLNQRPTWICLALWSSDSLPVQNMQVRLGAMGILLEAMVGFNQSTVKISVPWMKVSGSTLTLLSLSVRVACGLEINLLKMIIQ